MDDESNAGVEITVEAGSELETEEGVEAEGSVRSADTEDDTDWKAIAEKQIADNENLKKALTQKRQLRNKVTTSPETEEESEEDDEDRPATIADIRKVVSEAVATKPSIDAVLAEKVSDPLKRTAVRAIYEGRIRQTGTSDEAIRADIDAALAIADSHKLRKTNEELKRAANQPKIPPMAGAGADRAPDPKSHKFSDEQVKNLTATAVAIGADPKKFIEQSWKNQQGR